jgi:hypothetical protein
LITRSYNKQLRVREKEGREWKRASRPVILHGKSHEQIRQAAALSLMGDEKQLAMYGKFSDADNLQKTLGKLLFNGML